MSAPDYYIQHGTRNFRIEPERLVSRHREPDSVSLSYQAESADAYAIGAEIDGLANLPIVERERTKDGPLYLYRLLLEGIADPAKFFVETDYEESSPEEGWDEIRRVVFTRDPDHYWFTKGERLVDENTNIVIEGFENLYITDRTKRKHRAAGYYEVAMTLKGLKGAKTYKRRISGNVVTSVTRSEGSIGIVGDRYENFPPVDSGTNDSLSLSDGDEVEYDAASLQISDTHITASPPPTEYIGQPWTPPDPPDVVVLSLYGEKVKKFWPFGWVCNSMPCEKLGVAGADLWLVTVNYTFKVPTIPVTS